MDKNQIMMIIVGVILIIVGAISTKVKKNSVIGIRIPWAMYNENTWKKSNLFGGILILIAGVVTLVSSLIFDFNTCMIISLCVIVVVAFATVIRAKMIYDEEIKK